MPTVPEAPGVYIGGETTILGIRPGRPYLLPDGSRLQARIIPTLMGDHIPRFYLEPGQVILWTDSEVYGETHYLPRGAGQQQRWLGLGWKVLPEHAGLDTNTLIDLGYQFTEPRADVEPVIPLEEWEKMQQQANHPLPIAPLPLILSEAPAEPGMPADQEAVLATPEAIPDDLAPSAPPLSEPVPETAVGGAVPTDLSAPVALAPVVEPSPLPEAETAPSEENSPAT